MAPHLSSYPVRRAGLLVGTCLLLLGIASAGCSGTSPTAPAQVPITPSPPASDPVTPSPGVRTLTGRVTETAPTSGSEIYPALVTITNGPDQGKVAATDPAGFYSIDGLRPGIVTVVASAEGFQSASRAVNVGVETTAEFQLARTFGMMKYTLSGDLKATDGTCSDGVGQKPCRIIAFPVHNAGPVDVELQWNPEAGVELAVALFQTPTQTLIAASGAGASGKRIHSLVAGHAVYELHITYTQGTTDAMYSVVLSYPN